MDTRLYLNAKHLPSQLVLLFCGLIETASASIIVEGTAISSGNSSSYSFVNDTDSNVLVFGFYVNADTSPDDVTYAGDSATAIVLAPDGRDRTGLAYFLNPGNTSGQFQIVGSGSSRTPHIVYELSGVDTGAAVITNSAGLDPGTAGPAGASDTSTTTTITAADSFLISFFGKGGTAFDTNDMMNPILDSAPAGFGNFIASSANPTFQGSVTSGSGTFGPADITIDWRDAGNSRDGQVTIVFAAAPIPEPSSILILSLLLIGAFALHLRSKSRSGSAVQSASGIG